MSCQLEDDIFETLFSQWNVECLPGLEHRYVAGKNGYAANISTNRHPGDEPMSEHQGFR